MVCRSHSHESPPNCANSHWTPGDPQKVTKMNDFSTFQLSSPGCSSFAVCWCPQSCFHTARRQREHKKLRVNMPSKTSKGMGGYCNRCSKTWQKPWPTTGVWGGELKKQMDDFSWTSKPLTSMSEHFLEPFASPGPRPQRSCIFRLIELKTLENEICAVQEGRTTRKLPVFGCCPSCQLHHLCCLILIWKKLPHKRQKPTFLWSLQLKFNESKRNSLIPCCSDLPASQLFASTLQLCALDEELASSPSKDASPVKYLWLRGCTGGQQTQTQWWHNILS